VVEDGLAADGRHSDAVAKVGNAGHGPLERPVRRAEAEPVQERDRPGAHGDDVAEDAPDPGGRALERLDRRGVVVALDLERDREAFPEVDDAGVLARALEHPVACGGQPFQKRRRVLVAAVLRPEQGKDGELEVVRAASEQLLDALKLTVGETELAVERLSDPRQGSESSRACGCGSQSGINRR
jgi:hypothetical protein